MFSKKEHLFFNNILQTENCHALTQIKQRRDFYLWYYIQISNKNYKIKWPFAAYLVADAAYKLANHDFIVGNNNIERFLRTGNQLIFDDVLPKLNKAFINNKLEEESFSKKWDETILWEEQHLIQPLYNSLNIKEYNNFSKISKNEDAFVFLGKLLFGKVYLNINNINQGLYMPSFPSQWHLSNKQHRYYYGLIIGEIFCNNKTLERLQKQILKVKIESDFAINTIKNQEKIETQIFDSEFHHYLNNLINKSAILFKTPKTISDNYTIINNNSIALQKVNTKEYLHLLSSILTDFFIDKAEVVIIENLLVQIKNRYLKGNKVELLAIEKDPFYFKKLATISYKLNTNLLNSIKDILSKESIKTFNLDLQLVKLIK